MSFLISLWYAFVRFVYSIGGGPKPFEFTDDGPFRIKHRCQFPTSPRTFANHYLTAAFLSRHSYGVGHSRCTARPLRARTRRIMESEVSGS